MDVGAQAERTALAWQRTGLAAMVLGVLLAHATAPPWPGLLLVAVAGLTTVVLGPQRYRRVLRTVRAGHTPLSRRMVPGAALLFLVVTAGTAVSLLRS